MMKILTQKMLRDKPVTMPAESAGRQNRLECDAESFLILVLGCVVTMGCEPAKDELLKDRAH